MLAMHVAENEVWLPGICHWGRLVRESRRRRGRPCSTLDSPGKISSAAAAQLAACWAVWISLAKYPQRGLRCRLALSRWLPFKGSSEYTSGDFKCSWWVQICMS